MARLILTILAAAGAVFAANITVQYATVPKDEIERRLHSIETSNIKREQVLLKLFETSGCTGEHLSEQVVKNVKAPNVICTLPGETDSSIIVGAHFDFVDRGRGAVDNWSGSALLPSLYQSLDSVPRRHTMVFVGFTDEEKGLIGSKFYLHEMPPAAVAKIRAMVNMDSLGTSPTKVEIDRGDKFLLNALGIASQTFKLPLSVVNVHAVGRSDSDSFQDRHVPALSIHSLTRDTFPILHSPRDRMDAIHLDVYYDTYLLMRAYIAYLDQVLDSQDASQETAPAVVK
ncbi:MAG TPA: M28 family peptidase [Bryobacteraceae bacterium]|nr:M28 family peptidase [Bryobacteraceae bacterium]